MSFVSSKPVGFLCSLRFYASFVVLFDLSLVAIRSLELFSLSRVVFPRFAPSSGRSSLSYATTVDYDYAHERPLMPTSFSFFSLSLSSTRRKQNHEYLHSHFDASTKSPPSHSLLLQLLHLGYLPTSLLLLRPFHSHQQIPSRSRATDQTPPVPADDPSATRFPTKKMRC